MSLLLPGIRIILAYSTLTARLPHSRSRTFRLTDYCCLTYNTLAIDVQFTDGPGGGFQCSLQKDSLPSYCSFRSFYLSSCRILSLLLDRILQPCNVHPCNLPLRPRRLFKNPRIHTSSFKLKVCGYIGDCTIKVRIIDVCVVGFLVVVLCVMSWMQAVKPSQTAFKQSRRGVHLPN